LSQAIIADFGNGSANKKIPAWVIDSPKEFREALIDGYWRGDGSIAYTGWNMRGHASSDSKELAMGIQLILASLGIQCVVIEYHYKPKGFVNPHEVHYRMEIGASSVGSMPEMTHRKKEECRKKYKHPLQDCINVAPVPANLTKGTLRYKGKKGYGGNANVRKHCKHPVVDKLTNGNILWDVVTKIEESPYEDYTYDLEIDCNNTFVLASGIAVHNTQGGHWKVYDYIPENEVWIERMKDPMENKFTLMHELPEVLAMDEFKMPYLKAHDKIANPIEQIARKEQDPKKVDEKLEEVLDKFSDEAEVKRLLSYKPKVDNYKEEEPELSVPKRYYLGRKLRPTGLTM
jgi:hypothetical protein